MWGGRGFSISLNGFGSRVASLAQDSLLWLLPPSQGPISLTHISQGLFLDPGLSRQRLHPLCVEERAVMQGRQGGGNDCGGEGGDHSGRNVVGNELFA